MSQLALRNTQHSPVAPVRPVYTDPHPNVYSFTPNLLHFWDVYVCSCILCISEYSPLRLIMNLPIGVPHVASIAWRI